MSVLEKVDRIFRFGNKGNELYYAFFSESNFFILKELIKTKYDIKTAFYDDNELIETMVFVFQHFGCYNLEQLNDFTVKNFYQKARELENTRYNKNVLDNETNEFLQMHSNPLSSKKKENLQYDTNFIKLDHERRYDYFWIDK